MASKVSPDEEAGAPHAKPRHSHHTSDGVIPVIGPLSGPSKPPPEPDLSKSPLKVGHGRPAAANAPGPLELSFPPPLAANALTPPSRSALAAIRNLPFRRAFQHKRRLEFDQTAGCGQPRFADNVLEASWLAMRERLMQELVPWGYISLAAILFHAVSVGFGILAIPSQFVFTQTDQVPGPVQRTLSVEWQILLAVLTGTVPSILSGVMSALYGRGFAPDGVMVLSGDVDCLHQRSTESDSAHETSPEPEMDVQPVAVPIRAVSRDCKSQVDADEEEKASDSRSPTRTEAIPPTKFTFDETPSGCLDCPCWKLSDACVMRVRVACGERARTCCLGADADLRAIRAWRRIRSESTSTDADEEVLRRHEVFWGVVWKLLLAVSMPVSMLLNFSWVHGLGPFHLVSFAVMVVILSAVALPTFQGGVFATVVVTLGALLALLLDSTTTNSITTHWVGITVLIVFGTITLPVFSTLGARRLEMLLRGSLAQRAHTERTLHLIRKELSWLRLQKSERAPKYGVSPAKVPQSSALTQLLALCNDEPHLKQHISDLVNSLMSPRGTMSRNLRGELERLIPKGHQGGGEAESQPMRTVSTHTTSMHDSGMNPDADTTTNTTKVLPFDGGSRHHMKHRGTSSSRHSRRRRGSSHAEALVPLTPAVGDPNDASDLSYLGAAAPGYVRARRASARHMLSHYTIARGDSRQEGRTVDDGTASAPGAWPSPSPQGRPPASAASVPGERVQSPQGAVVQNPLTSPHRRRRDKRSAKLEPKQSLEDAAEDVLVKMGVALDEDTAEWIMSVLAPWETKPRLHSSKLSHGRRELREMAVHRVGDGQRVRDLTSNPSGSGKAAPPQSSGRLLPGKPSSDGTIPTTDQSHPSQVGPHTPRLPGQATDSPAVSSQQAPDSSKPSSSRQAPLDLVGPDTSLEPGASPSRVVPKGARRNSDGNVSGATSRETTPSDPAHAATAEANAPGRRFSAQAHSPRRSSSSKSVAGQSGSVHSGVRRHSLIGPIPGARKPSLSGKEARDYSTVRDVTAPTYEQYHEAIMAFGLDGSLEHVSESAHEDETDTRHPTRGTAQTAVTSSLNDETKKSLESSMSRRNGMGTSKCSFRVVFKRPMPAAERQLPQETTTNAIRPSEPDAGGVQVYVFGGTPPEEVGLGAAAITSGPTMQDAVGVSPGSQEDVSQPALAVEAAMLGSAAASVPGSSMSSNTDSTKPPQQVPPQPSERPESPQSSASFQGSVTTRPKAVPQSRPAANQKGPRAESHARPVLTKDALSSPEQMPSSNLIEKQMSDLDLRQGRDHSSSKEGTVDTVEDVTKPAELARLPTGRRRSQMIVDYLGQIGEFQFDVDMLAAMTAQQPLLAVSVHLAGKLRFRDITRIHMDRFQLFVRAIERSYDPLVPYHFSSHAADVVSSCYRLLRRYNGLEPLEVSAIQLLSLFVAAIIHDAGHPGVDNSYLIKHGDPLAIDHNDNSPLENHHLALSFHLMQIPSLDFAMDLNAEEWTAFRSDTVALVLATDMAKAIEINNRFQFMVNLRTTHGSLRGSESSGDESAASSKESQDSEGARDRSLLERQVLLKCADLGHVWKPTDLHLKWSYRVQEEFMRQGDRERAAGEAEVVAMRDRCKLANMPRGQAFFLEIIAQPLVELWCRFASDKEPLKQLNRNKRYWVKLLEQGMAPSQEDLDLVNPPSTEALLLPIGENGRYRPSLEGVIHTTAQLAAAGNAGAFGKMLTSKMRSFTSSENVSSRVGGLSPEDATPILRAPLWTNLSQTPHGMLSFGSFVGRTTPDAMIEQPSVPDSTFSAGSFVIEGNPARSPEALGTPAPLHKAVSAPLGKVALESSSKLRQQGSSPSLVGKAGIVSPPLEVLPELDDSAVPPASKQRQDSDEDEEIFQTLPRAAIGHALAHTRTVPTTAARGAETGRPPASPRVPQHLMAAEPDLPPALPKTATETPRLTAPSMFDFGDSGEQRTETVRLGVAGRETDRLLGASLARKQTWEHFRSVMGRSEEPSV
jgi:hypothetical protein